SVDAPRARASGLASPTLLPLATLPWRWMAPVANNNASARLVFPAPAGPTSATALGPFLVPFMTILLLGRRAAWALSETAILGVARLRLSRAQRKSATQEPGETAVVDIAWLGQVLRYE